MRYKPWSELLKPWYIYYWEYTIDIQKLRHQVRGSLGISPIFISSFFCPQQFSVFPSPSASYVQTWMFSAFDLELKTQNCFLHGSAKSWKDKFERVRGRKKIENTKLRPNFPEKQRRNVCIFCLSLCKVKRNIRLDSIYVHYKRFFSNHFFDFIFR